MVTWQGGGGASRPFLLPKTGWLGVLVFGFRRGYAPSFGSQCKVFAGIHVQKPQVFAVGSLAVET